MRIGATIGDDLDRVHGGRAFMADALKVRLGIQKTPASGWKL